MNKNILQPIMISLASLLIVNLIFAYLLPTPQIEEIISWIITNILIIMILVISWLQLPSKSLRSSTTIFLSVSTIFIAELILSLLFILINADMRTTLYMEAALFLLLILVYSAACYFTADDITLQKTQRKSIPHRTEYTEPKLRKPMIK
jgi:hypothetical protein